MKDIVIIGTGGLACEIKYLIDAINRKEPEWNMLGYIENWSKQVGDEVVDGYKVIGTTDDFNKIENEIYAVIGVGFPERIKEIADLLHNPKAKYPNLIHPSVEINSNETIGMGNIISYASWISCHVILGDFNFFNIRCHVGHDARIGSYNVFNPNTQISGSVVVGNENFFGMNSSIIQGKKVGNNNKIGAYSFVVRNVKNHESLFGIPAIKQ